MNNPESLRKLLHAMSDFNTVYNLLKAAIAEYEEETDKSIDELPGYWRTYPFDKRFDELEVDHWVNVVVDRIRHSAFKVTDHEYLNTGGQCMVGVSTVWLPERKQTVYVFVNEEGYTMSIADYIRNDLDVYDYDELVIAQGDWGRITGDECYFELYRHCYNEYIKSDCRYFQYHTEVPYMLLSDELQKQVDADYLVWLESEHGRDVETDGFNVFIASDYSDMLCDTAARKDVDDFRSWHHDVPSYMHDGTSVFDKDYIIKFADKEIRIPFNADTYDAMDTFLKSVVDLW